MSNNLETRIRNAMCEELQLYENQGHLEYIKNNSGGHVAEYTYKKGIRKGTTKKRFFKYGKKGSADIIIFANAKTFFIEVKVKNNTLDEDQIEFKARVERQGFEYTVMREDYDLRAFLKQRGII